MKLLILVSGFTLVVATTALGLITAQPAKTALPTVLTECGAFDKFIGLQSPINDTDSCTPLNLSKEAGRGCCSHHGGECGCADGRSVCCDGQLSPSCGC